MWDRRALSEEHPQPVGVLAGHADGITCVDAKVGQWFLLFVSLKFNLQVGFVLQARNGKGGGWGWGT